MDCTEQLGVPMGGIRIRENGQKHECQLWHCFCCNIPNDLKNSSFYDFNTNFHFTEFCSSRTNRLIVKRVVSKIFMKCSNIYFYSFRFDCNIGPQDRFWCIHRFRVALSQLFCQTSLLRKRFSCKTLGRYFQI